MKNIIYFWVWLLPATAWGQEYFSGKLNDGRQQGHIYYDRTQIQFSRHSFQTVYKVFDNDLNQTHTITLSHDRQKNYLFVQVKQTNGLQDQLAVKYERDKSGLIFCDVNNLDTVFNQVARYTYLLSFADSVMDYPILHQLRFAGNFIITLDPLNKVRLRKHAEAVNRLIRSNPALARQQMRARPISDEEREEYSLKLVITKMRAAAQKIEEQQRDSINEFHRLLTKLTKENFGAEPSAITGKKFAGDKKNGRLYGRGIMVEDGNVYYGAFEKGVFLRGIVLVNTAAGTYCGYMVHGRFNGLGKLTMPNGNYQMGYFTDDKLTNGFIQTTELNGDVYRGRVINGQRKGYGELSRPNGTLYIGDFSNVTFVRGFAKEVDPFGYVLYSKVESGEKTGITPQEGEAVIGKDAVAGKN
ncbi:MAG: hypothetical protein NZM35_00215 [Chitinophagales bacterium]|nr:hypothetical protein [Chitinophagales bacterium]MDW8417869.1 hypothetical protein [Chitinophagales bacterium]